jgi:outer membrane receptor protein involved in Fe transport
MIQVTEQGGSIPGLVYRSNPLYSDNRNTSNYVRAALSYVTGAHAFKVGFNDGWGVAGPNRMYSLQPVSYRFNNGVPNQISLFATPYASTTNVDSDLGVYAQDRWTMLNRLTVTLGVRYDYFADSFPSQTAGPSVLAPNRNITFPEQANLSWHDVTPKTGAVYDLFGNGGTAV